MTDATNLLTFLVDEKLLTIIRLAMDYGKAQIPYAGGKLDPNPGLWLVKDQGIYLMNAWCGTPEQPPKVAYAQTYYPESPNVWDRARAIVGGDDFAALITIDKTWAALQARDKVVIEPHPDCFDIHLCYLGAA